MSEGISVVVPDDWRVSTSTKAGQVILKIEVRVEGEAPGDPRAEQRYLLGPYEAIALGRQLQDRSMKTTLDPCGLRSAA